MKLRPLGRTGLQVSELCFGTMTFGGSGKVYEAIGALDQKSANDLVGRALDAGINFFDTADMYAGGESETMLGKALGSRKKDVVLASKVGFPAGSGPRESRLTRAHIQTAIEGSLRRLDVEAIDLYLVHRFEPRTPLDEQMRALDDLVRAGRVRWLGVSNFAAWQMMKANALAQARGGARFDVAQMYYNPLARELERDVVPFLLDQQMGLMIWSPLAGGVLTGKYGSGGQAPKDARRAGFELGPLNWGRAQRILDAMKPIAAQHGRSIAQVALAWLLAKPVVTSVILGAKKASQLDDNLGAATLALDSDQVAAIDRASTLTPEYPGWYLEQFANL